MFKSKSKATVQPVSAPPDSGIAQEFVADKSSAPGIAVQFLDWLCCNRKMTATKAAAAFVENTVKVCFNQVDWDEWNTVFETALNKCIKDGSICESVYEEDRCPVGGEKYRVSCKGLCTAVEKATGFIGGSPEEMSESRRKWYVRSAVDFYLSSDKNGTSSYPPVRYSKTAKTVIAEMLDNDTAGSTYASVNIGKSDVDNALERCCQAGTLRAKCSGTETWTDAGWLRPIVGYAVAPFADEE